jgi:hypothetical protein
MIAARLSIAERQPLFVSVMRLSSLLLHTLAVYLRLPATPVVDKAISSSLITSCSYGKTATNLVITPYSICGSGSVVGIATGYGLDGPGIESRWVRDFLHLSRPALGPT